MKKFMNLMSCTGGFTLVELIVVIAVLAILAGVAIPTYTGYIKKAEASADNQILAAVKTAVDAALVSEGVVTEIVVTDKTDAAAYSVVAKIGSNTYPLTSGTSTEAADFKTFMAGNDVQFKQDYAKATWSAGTWTFGN